ncbi:hypothetical protein DL98DRAFT_180378 [Cadophora sp. DSE1049]|nr:hypothetical protein DL98DRAFT_180378 [Cadophora sp. DSE1049]
MDFVTSFRVLRSRLCLLRFLFVFIWKERFFSRGVHSVFKIAGCEDGWRGVAVAPRVRHSVDSCVLSCFFISYDSVGFSCFFFFLIQGLTSS